MLHSLITILIGWLTISSCANENNRTVKVPTKTSIDTTIYRKTITKELPGGAYRKRATSYSLIIDKDTSHLECYFEEYNNGKVGFQISFADNKKYATQFIELESLIKAASTEYNMDSLSGAFLYLIETGDLAIDITRQLSDKDIKNVTNNRSTATFLLKSKLTDDLNSLLLSYKKEVQQYAIEHPMLIDSSEIIKYNQIDTPKNKIPKKILDGTIWIYFK